MYWQEDQLAPSRTQSGHKNVIHNDFFNLIENHSFTQDDQGEFDYESTSDNSKYSKPSNQDYSQSNFMDFDENLVSELHHRLEFAQPIHGAQGETTATVTRNNNSLLPHLNAAEVNNFIPIPHITPSKPMDQNWDIIKKVTETVQIEDKLLLPPVKNYQQEVENHTIDKNQSTNASRT